MVTGATGLPPKPKLADVAAALLKAKRAGQLPSAFGEMMLPGIDDELSTSDVDATAISNHVTHAPSSGANGIQTQTLPKTSIGSQSGQSKQQGQQPLRSVHAIRKHFKRLTSAVGFANET